MEIDPDKSGKIVAKVILGLVVACLLLIGLGPIRRIAKPIIPDILENKVNINSVCDGATKLYIFTSDSGDISTQAIVGGCLANSKPENSFQK